MTTTAEQTATATVKTAEPRLPVHVKVDVDAALLRGEIVPESAIVEITAGELKSLSIDERALLLSWKSRGLYGGTSGEITVPTRVSEPTFEGVLGVIKSKIQEDIDRIAKQAEESKLAFEEFKTEAEKYLLLTPELGPLEIRKDLSIKYSFYQNQGYRNETCCDEIEGFMLDSFKMKTQFVSSLSLNVYNAYNAEVRELKEQIEAHLAKYHAKNLEIAEANKEKVLAWFAQKEKEEKDKEKAEAERMAELRRERLKSGVWSYKHPSYNGNRYGQPWAAKVKGGEQKLVYDFVGNYDGDDDGGCLRVPCLPGEIVAWGQKDHRGRKSTHYLLIMKADGGVEYLSKTEASSILCKPIKKKKIELSEAQELARRLDALRKMKNPSVIDDLKD